MTRAWVAMAAAALMVGPTVAGEPATLPLGALDLSFCDESGSPVPFVRVFIARSGRDATSDQLGRRHIRSIPPGRHRLLATCPGYEPRSFECRVKPGEVTALRISLDHAKEVATIDVCATDEQGSPMPYVNVILVDTPLGALTDGSGHGRIRDVAPGTYELKASYIGYESLTLDCAVRSGAVTTLNIDFTERMSDKELRFTTYTCAARSWQGNVLGQLYWQDGVPILCLFNVGATPAEVEIYERTDSKRGRRLLTTRVERRARALVDASDLARDVPLELEMNGEAWARFGIRPRPEGHAAAAVQVWDDYCFQGRTDHRLRIEQERLIYRSGEVVDVLLFMAPECEYLQLGRFPSFPAGRVAEVLSVDSDSLRIDRQGDLVTLTRHPTVTGTREVRLRLRMPERRHPGDALLVADWAYTIAGPLVDVGRSGTMLRAFQVDP